MIYSTPRKKKKTYMLSLSRFYNSKISHKISNDDDDDYCASNIAAAPIPVPIHIEVQRSPVFFLFFK
jgi:hypothetical protein